MGINVIHSNARRSSDAVATLLMATEANDSTVIAICESPRSTHTMATMISPGLKCYSNRGASLICSDVWQISAQPVEFPVIAVRTRVENKQVGVIEFHWRYWKDPNGEIFTKIQSILRNELNGHDTIIMGDANTEHPLWSLNCPRRNACFLIDLVSIFNLRSAFEPEAENWTYRSDRGKKSWLDVILTSQKRVCTRQEMIETPGSDHRALACQIDLSSIAKKDQRRCDWKKVTQSIIAVEEKYTRPYTLPLNEDWFRDEYFGIISLLSNILANCAINNDGISICKIDRLMRKRRHLRNKIRRLKMNETNIERFLLWSRKLESVNDEVRHVNKGKALALNKRIRDGKESAWSICNQVLGKNWTKLKGESYSQYLKAQLEDREKFMEQFKGCSNPEMVRPTLNSWPLFTVPEWNEIQRLVGKKRCMFERYLDSKGMAILLKHHPRSKSFIELCFRHSFAPIQCLSSRIQLIDKNDGLRVRPIAIQNPISRCLDACFFVLLHRYPIFEIPRQFGFLKEKSTDELFIRWSEIIERIKSNKNSYCLMWNYDFSNAFEDFLWQKSCEKLKRAVPQAIIEFLSFVLKNRTSFIVAEDGTRWRSHKTGSFQGGFVSPLLFAIATKDLMITSALGIKLFMFKFADDFIIISEPIILRVSQDKRRFAIKKSFLCLKNKLTISITKQIETLARPLGLKLNKDKTKCITLTNSRKLMNLLGKSELINDKLQFMGVELSTGRIPRVFPFITRRITEIEALFRRKSNELELLPTKALSVIYDSLINSIMRFFACFTFRFSEDKLSRTCLRIAEILCNMKATPLLFELLESKNPHQAMEDHFITKCRKYGTTNIDMNKRGVAHMFLRNETKEAPVFLVDEDFLPVLEKRSNLDWPSRVEYGIKKIHKKDRRYQIITYRSQYGEELTISQDLWGSLEAEIGEWAITSSILNNRSSISPFKLSILRIPKNWVSKFNLNRHNLINCMSSIGGHWIVIAMNVYKSRTSLFQGCPILVDRNDMRRKPILHREITKRLNHWMTMRHTWQDLLTTSGAWHKLAKTRIRCRCGGPLTSRHFLNSCLMLNQYKSMWLREISKFNWPINMILHKAKSLNKLEDIQKVIKIALRFNGVNLTLWSDPRNIYDKIGSVLERIKGTK